MSLSRLTLRPGSLRPGTIRARLALSIALVLLVTLTALGVAMVVVVRATLTDQLDDQVLGAAAQLMPPGPGGGNLPACHRQPADLGLRRGG